MGERPRLTRAPKLSTAAFKLHAASESGLVTVATGAAPAVASRPVAARLAGRRHPPRCGPRIDWGQIGGSSRGGWRPTCHDACRANGRALEAFFIQGSSAGMVESYKGKDAGRASAIELRALIRRVLVPT